MVMSNGEAYGIARRIFSGPVRYFLRLTIAGLVLLLGFMVGVTLSAIFLHAVEL
jgi:uncharacterized membrane protein YjgN (DUF898 family)